MMRTLALWSALLVAALLVIALAVGAAAGRGLGDNSKATIITRGLVEITRLGLELGARPETFSGLAGMGDLVATCSSPLSRNQTFGRHLGEGMSVAEAATNVEVLASLEKAVASANEHVSRAESIRKIKVLTTDFTEANGLLTPSLKVKRLEATRRLAPVIDEIYGGPVQA